MKILLPKRAGLRNNLSDTKDKALTAGIGLNLLLVHVDVGAYKGFEDNSAGVAVQLGVEF